MSEPREGGASEPGAIPGALDRTRQANPPAIGPMDRTVHHAAGPDSTRAGSGPFDRTRVPGRAADAPPPPRLFGKYEILGEVARGGMGVVYRAQQQDADRVVALKVLLAGEFAAADDERRFLHEAELAAQLNHPNIVAIYDIGREQGRRYYTMELVDGKLLGAWAMFHDLEDRLRVFIKICRAIHSAHLKGIIHRDLKPSNVLVTPAGEPKILDFGLAKLARGGASSMNTVTGQTLGTPYWMAPEQAAGRVHDVDIRSDVWGLGVILFELVTDGLPFPGSELMSVLAAIQHDDPAPFKGPEELRVVALKAIEKEQSRRYGTADALAEDIERFLAGEPVSARAPSIKRMAQRWAKRHPATVAATLAAVIVMTVAIVWEMTRPGELRIDFQQADAMLEVDGKRAEKVSKVSAGPHSIRISAPGRETVTDEVYVGRGESRAMKYDLPMSTGLLDLDADEQGTTVRLGDVVHGLPLRGHAVPIGVHELTFQRRGFESVKRTVVVRRNETTSAWASLPDAKYRLGRSGNTFDGPVVLRDIDGDGVADPSQLAAQILQVMDGQKGDWKRKTHYEKVVGREIRGMGNVDGDGVDDDVTLLKTIDQVRVAAWSGAQTGIPGVPPEQKCLWRFAIPAMDARHFWEPPVVAEGEVWVPSPDGARRLRSSDGVEIGRFESKDGPIPFRVTSNRSAVFAVIGEEVLRLDLRGETAWSTRLGPGCAFVDWFNGIVVLDAEGTLLVRAGMDVLALRAKDGSQVWRMPLGTQNSILFTAPGLSNPPEIYNSHDHGLQILDAANGQVLTTGPKPVTGHEGFAVGRGRWTEYVNGTEICHSSRTGKELWRVQLPKPVSSWSTFSTLPGDLEWATVLEDRRLWVIDAEGRLSREIPLEFVPRNVHACELDSDGRTDYAMVGFGLQTVRSSRVLWRRTGSNAMRPKPALLYVKGLPAIVEVSRWETGNTELRCFRGATGEILWSHPEPMDVMHEPGIGDFDGDGTADVFTQVGVQDFRFSVFSGVDGHELAHSPLPSTPYPPAILKDLDGDGKLEAIISPYKEGLRAVSPGKANPLWSAEGPPVYAPILQVDLDGDGKLEFVATHPTSDAPGFVTAWSLEGRKVWEASVGLATWGPAFAMDLDGDGKPELGVPGNGDLVVLGRDGKELKRIPKLGGTYQPPVVLPGGDLVLGVFAGCVRIRPDGTEVWRHSGKRTTGSVGVAVLPGSEVPAVIAADLSGILFVLDADTGRERWSLNLGAGCENGILLADLTGDGIPEATVGLNDFSIVVLDLR